MPTALVTGASGFIGPRLVMRLQSAGHDVACLVRAASKTQRLEQLGARLVRGDVTDPGSLAAAIDGVEHVYHLAGRTHAKNLDSFLSVNEAGTANLLEACARRDAPPVVLAVSSLAAAGPSAPAAPHRESDAPRPISLYGRSKLAGEQAARRFAADVPLTILRPPVVFGPGDHDGLNLFLGLKYSRLHPVPQRKGLPLSLVHADDLADAMALAVERGERVPAGADDPGHGVYYAADPAVSSWADAGRMAADAMGVRIVVVKLRKYPFLIPALAGELIGRVTGKPTLFGLDKLREASATGWVCSVAKAEEQLGFRCAKPLAERYHETAEWYREEGWI
ncbi:dTDP-4-oxo-6-deoxy-D-allose reductase [Posidoniimonas polymericola]|uniref:dTDP-4-oxo-6-deoxy-D-allose reductase n=1 Tax=Posidoniimonas polymericola TaxID=2528002 RepID=A0A5C5YUG4_9BACT|nr:NAD-dependent epimerase/dehydratase family protein [Posidoniimonas polymericola]TWT78471.1 dTDP-4-oxo-6-deoxy-D-allose reductase [Posidoniimonas polymericola]